MLSSFLWTVLAVFAEDPPSTLLTIGRPAPTLAPMVFLKGDPVEEFARGTVYVIEFSGVECVPCHRVIPLLTDLQKAHPAVVIISVYEDDEKAVREFLDGGGKAIGFRVAVDPSGTMWKNWSEPAYQIGIPHAFVVDGGGTVAWIGDPNDLAEPLGQIVAGQFDPRSDMMRLRVEQGIAIRERRLRDREESGTIEYSRVNELAIAGKLAVALAATDAALVDYADCPNATALFRRMKLYLLANLPGRKDEAVALGTELAIEARMSDDWVKMANTSSSLLSAADRANVSERDQRLVDLAVTLLRREPKDLLRKPKVEAEKLRAVTLGILGWAYHLRGDYPRAIDAMKKALNAMEQLKTGSGREKEDLADDRRQIVEDLRTRLAEYQRAANTSTK